MPIKVKFLKNQTALNKLIYYYAIIGQKLYVDNQFFISISSLFSLNCQLSIYLMSTVKYSVFLYIILFIEIAWLSLTQVKLNYKYLM
jgi:hypothetical protein